MNEVENPMVIERIWQHKEQVKVIDECAGCMEDITEGEEVFEFTNMFGLTALVHDNPRCCRALMADICVVKTAGE